MVRSSVLAARSCADVHVPEPASVSVLRPVVATLHNAAAMSSDPAAGAPVPYVVTTLAAAALLTASRFVVRAIAISGEVVEQRDQIPLRIDRVVDEPEVEGLGEDRGGR